MGATAAATGQETHEFQVLRAADGRHHVQGREGEGKKVETG